MEIVETLKHFLHASACPIFIMLESSHHPTISRGGLLHRNPNHKMANLGGEHLHGISTTLGNIVDCTCSFSENAYQIAIVTF